MTRLKILNDFAFQKALGEKGDEPQLLSFLNVVLERTGKNNLASVEILVAKFRRLKEWNLENPLYRWLAYFDEHSPEDLIEEVLRWIVRYSLYTYDK
jgi:hypothetical protein